MKKTVGKRETPGALTAGVVNLIRENVASGRLAPGQYVPSERDLAKQLGVSRVTVRRGFDQLVKDGLLSREPGRGYVVPDRNGRSNGKNGGSGPALVFVHAHPEIELAAGTYHARMWAGAREEAARAGYLTMISSIKTEALTASKAQDLARVAAGVLCDHVDPRAIRTLLQAGIPVVQVDYYRDEMHVDVIVQDDVGGILQAVEHLHSRGHRRIGYLDTSAGLRAEGQAANSERRRAGFLLACSRFGLDSGHVAEGLWSTGEAAEGTRRVLDQGVTAVVLPHAELWPSARETLRERGVALPGKFGVVVWGDPPERQEKGFPTAVTWNKEQMGREGVRRLLNRLQNPGLEPATVVIPARLVDRGTGGAN